jgi:hypothetical protein
MALAQSTSQDQPTESLADAARRLKAQQGQTTPKQGKVFTNDDVATSKPSGGTTDSSSTATGTDKSGSGGAHGEKYYRKEYSKLMAKKEMDQRQLEVLQKKLNQNDVQHYTDPNQGLQQQYTREDINKNQDEMTKKQAKIAADDQAISDLQDQLRRDNGDPAWLVAGSVSIEPDVPDQANANSGDDKDKKKTKEYWQGKFQAARATLKKAEEAQKLVQDEMDFLKVRQIQEPSADAQADIKAKMETAQANIDAATPVTEKARKNLDDLQNAFNDSGAPAEWSQTEDAPQN